MNYIESIPNWMHSPPEGDAPQPPISTRLQHLPFGELTWKDFERLLLRIVGRDSSVLGCFLYGTAGQSQEGIDVLAEHEVEGKNVTVCYQCKNVKIFGSQKISDAVTTFLDGKLASVTTEFVLCTSIHLESTQQQDEIVKQRERLKTKGIKFSVLDAAPAGPLCEKLRSLPDIVDDFFGRGWTEIFCGEKVSGSLADRLNGYELTYLRSRLLTLYSIVFAQHDPGIPLSTEQNIDFRL
jgi:hypothetical protein